MEKIDIKDVSHQLLGVNLRKHKYSDHEQRDTNKLRPLCRYLFQTNSLWKKIKDHKYIVLISLFFGVIYSLISLVNHYYFRTYALDLGVYTNALYDYIRFQSNDSCVFKNVGENLLADHFDLYLIFFSPLSLLFGTYTLLIVQIIAVLYGGIGVYTFFKKIKKNIPVAFFATIYFYVFFGVFAAISFDYHSNVVAAALIPWLFYSVARRNYLVSSIFFLFVLV